MLSNDKHKAEQHSHTKLARFDFYYDRIKQGLTLLVLVATGIICLSFIVTLLYFHHLTQAQSKISDHQLRTDLLHFPGDDGLNRNVSDVTSEYDDSLNSLVVGPRSVNNHVVDALLASEDTSFYHHKGVLPKALFRAMFQDIFNAPVSSGGSTITQQLVKNQVLSNEKTYSRKANEIVLAMRTEHVLSKKEILYTYLNIVPFGRDFKGINISGIAPASYSLFGKSPNELNVAESAYLIGLLQSPYTYTPYHEDGTLKTKARLQVGIDRQHYVLRRMRVENKISEKDYEQAKHYDIAQHLQTAK
ncbi:penicillin-binding protein [Staphylococcus pettenkoferi]|uniref:transglycosylase domain-containing protein n=1 Tax=Staphylococcus pettenkoferi TaxID=170573 RepID=UPI0022729052|nr:transglycosylase domain-containing protein [Staphylococcus pettenkoferi]MCY1608183.1 penicillin-binding protein [Staphylococcus pettenkoferi]